MIAYLKRLIRNYFGFTGNQVSGFLVLIPLMVVIIFAPPVYRNWMAHSESDFSEEEAFLDSLVFATAVSLDPGAVQQNAVSYLAFDPNEIGETGLVQMGFPVAVAKRLVNYREKGGFFRIKSDLKKIYGLEPGLYHNIEPYILLPDRLEPARTSTDDTPLVNTKKTIVPFNLNTADTSQLKQVYGIGKVLATRIVKYRTQLGGFVSKKQLSEVYRLDSATITRLLDHAFIEENFQPEGININLATEAELGRHPYISLPVARSIVTYRFQHGKFTSVDDLDKIVALTSADLDRIKPYLIFE
jgi:DNA uptake protein ComE-like DNA-binding protein